MEACGRVLSACKRQTDARAVHPVSICSHDSLLLVVVDYRRRPGHTQGIIYCCYSWHAPTEDSHFVRALTSIPNGSGICSVQSPFINGHPIRPCRFWWSTDISFRGDEKQKQLIIIMIYSCHHRRPQFSFIDLVVAHAAARDEYDMCMTGDCRTKRIFD